MVAAATAVVVAAAVRTAAEGDIQAAGTMVARPAARTAVADHTLGTAAEQVRRVVRMPRRPAADRNPAIPGRGKEKATVRPLPRVTVLRAGIRSAERTAMKVETAFTVRELANRTRK
jgi:hypothetical protein